MLWLASQGLGGLEIEEIDAIRDFTLLWGLFEGKAMATEGSPAGIVAAVARMELKAAPPADVTAALDHWQHRYWREGAPTALFDGLRFRDNEYRKLVLVVLSGTRDEPRDVLAALLLITLRLRNNLFHGVKWQYFLQGQLGNFTYANRLLMAAIELAVPPP